MSEHVESAKEIQHLFKGIWTLEDMEKEDVKEVVKKAIEDPHSFVIKPQKEGGGNNFYDDDVKRLLLENDRDFLKQFLIMERIDAPEILAHMLRAGKHCGGCLTLQELGIYSSVFMDTHQVEPIENHTFGKLLRTKCKDCNEGGVNTGYSVVDQPWLANITEFKSEEILPFAKNF